MFVDEVEITLTAGHGGPGKASFYHYRRGPDGGNGGRGGDVYLQGTSDLTALERYAHQKDFKAENGQNGSVNTKDGEQGKDLVLLMPVGTELTNEELGEVIVINSPEEKILVCRGGLGGLGNAALKSARNTTPEKAQSGLPGEEKTFQVVLRLIADVGLIGLPSAGKSSLLNELTNAQAKIGNYPFTTLEPNLGVMENKDGSRLILADVPGLIEGAAEGKGLGIKFLKHIEKVKILAHCLAVDSQDLLADYETIRQELGKFNEELLKKKEIILLTKTDLVDEATLKEKLKILKKLKKTVIPVSIYDLDKINALQEELSKED